MAKNEELLKRIREDFRYHEQYWRENYEEAKKDMQYAAAQPWTADEKAEREGRPCLVPDELSQYVKQANNNLRQNKRSIKVNPKGSGATDKDAEWRGAVIRGIEYASSAQAAYTTGFESAAWCGFGAWRVSYSKDKHGQAQPRIKRIPNALTVLWDPDAREADFSDQKRCFLTDTIREKDFARKYPKAKTQSFTKDDRSEASEWFKGESIVIAEAWYAEDDKVTQHITNGVEILETTEWIGSWIPIIGVFGEEVYTDEGGRSKRLFMSLIRRARDAQKMMCFVASQQAEEFGMSPRAPFVGYEGTFKDPDTVWATLMTKPRAFAEVAIPSPDIWPSQWGPPPLPTRPQFIPQSDAYERAYEQWRRSVQASMGISPLPTTAQRQNEKSGVALERIQTQEAVGSFHITDNFGRAMENTGRQLNELVTLTIKSPRKMPVRNADETHSLLHVTTQEHLPEDSEAQGMDEADYLIVDRGEFDVTISTGPNYQSQREEASEFVNNLLSSLGKLPMPPPLQMQILGLAVKLKNIGPIGEEIAKLLIPQSDQVNPQAQAAIAQAQGIVQELQKQLSELLREKEGKVVDNEYRMKIEQLKANADITAKQLDNEVKIRIAEITTKAQDARERDKLAVDTDTKLHVERHQAAHEYAMQKDQQAHESSMAEQQAQVAQAQQANQIAADQQATQAQGAD